LPLTPETTFQEVRADEDRELLARLSLSTLEFMRDDALAWESWLRHHRACLAFAAEEECDLLEAMHLSERLNRVGRNISRTGRTVERVHAEIVRRALSTI
jgi:hypothetical protein